MYDYDQDYVDRKYEQLSLKVIHRRGRTGFEETKDFPVRVNDLVAGRYQVSSVQRHNQYLTWCNVCSALFGTNLTICPIGKLDMILKDDQLTASH